MKTPILFFAAGVAAGAFVMWFVQSGETDGGGGGEKRAVASGAKDSEEKQKLTARVRSLEKELKEARSGAEKEHAVAAVPDEEGKGPQVFTSRFDDKHMEEMMKQGAERDVNREVDRMALRLNLTAGQKESLKEFLLAEKEWERAMFSEVRKNGGKIEVSKGQSKEEFLKSMLTPEQQTAYAKSREEQRTARAEEYAQRKVRTLNNDLNLTEVQKDKLFQAYAQQKLAATDPAKAGEPGDAFAAHPGGAIAFATVGAVAGGTMEHIEFEFDAMDLLHAGGSEVDRASLQSILTPEQLAVYDQRRAEELEHMKKTIQVEDLPLEPDDEDDGVAGGVIKIETNRTIVEPGK